MAVPTAINSCHVILLRAILPPSITNEVATGDADCRAGLMETFGIIVGDFSSKDFLYEHHHLDNIEAIHRLRHHLHFASKIPQADAR